MFTQKDGQNLIAFRGKPDINHVLDLIEP